MGFISKLSTSFLLFSLIFYSCGGGGGIGNGPAPDLGPQACAAPPTSRCRRNERLEIAREVIQNFTERITDDPQNVRSTWRGNDVCSYEGFACETRPDIQKLAVAGVDFNGFNLGGPNFTLSDLLDGLEDLAIFHVNSNNFELSIPQKVSEIEYLYELDVSNNKLSGQFPVEVLRAKNLTFLDLRFNQFYGPVPPEVFNMDLDVLFINNNLFSQNLPDNIGSTPAIYLTFANNKFTGPIPPSIGQAENLLEVLFLNNNFTGCLPYEIGNLTNTYAFDVESNQLTGPIPYSFACLASLQFLNLAYNRFYGTIPEMICKLPNLTNLSFSHNYFTQAGSECRRLIQNNVLDVRMNCILDLPSQRSREECSRFFTQRKNCTNEKTLTLIPCRDPENGFLNLTETSDQKSMLAAAPSPRTYDALKPHRW